MFEAEANSRIESAHQIPADIVSRFAELAGTLRAKTLLPWSEHCTECTAPACYTTCSLYAARTDLKCRRFTDGMVRIDHPASPNGYIVKVRFKRWGEVWAYGNTHLYPMATARALEMQDRVSGALAFRAPLPRALKERLMKRRYAVKRSATIRRPASMLRPNCFIIECYNPHDRTIDLSLTMTPADPKAKIKFQHLVPLRPGFNRERIPISHITRAIDVEKLFYLSMIPNEVDDGTALYFGVTDFAHDASFSPTQTKIKCVVWDLDNTLWDGTLIEDGVERLAPRAQALEAIKALDQRGILNTVASKNNEEEARAALKRFGFDDYILCPQITWGRKSAAVATIARTLNIGLDTILAVDDSAFERAEIHDALPEVRVTDAQHPLELLSRSDCDVPVSAQSAQRRRMYQEASVRQAAATNFGDDYMSFLRDCQIEVRVAPMTLANLERVHELTQRTNQMNFSGNRYSRELLQQILGQAELKTYVIDCQDRFGSYGTVGFCVVDSREPRITDLMFSCRIQSKRVEHAVLTYLLDSLIKESGKDCYVSYRQTPRNAPAGKVFDDFAMELVEEHDGVRLLVFRANRSIPNDALIRVSTQDGVAATAS